MRVNALLTGDEVTCKEAADFMPGIVTVATKRGIGMIAAESFHPKTVCAEIKKAASKAVRDRAKVQRFIVRPPVQVEIDFVRSGMADLAAIMPGAKRKSPVCVAFEAKDYLEAYRAFYAMMLLSYTFPY